MSFEVQMVSSFAGLFLGVILLMIVASYFRITKSTRYRKLLTDLYVAGKIKQLATKDKIDLAQEMKDFRTTIKKWKMDSQPLDDTIELELQEKVEEGNKDLNL